MILIPAALSVSVIVAVLVGFGLYVVPNLDPLANDSFLMAVVQILAIPAGGFMASAAILVICKPFGGIE